MEYYLHTLCSAGLKHQGWFHLKKKKIICEGTTDAVKMLVCMMHTPGGGGVLTYLAERGCAALMGGFFTRNP